MQMVSPDVRPKSGQPALIYSDGYYASFDGHVFPTDKYRRLYEKIIAGGLIDLFEVIEPRPAASDDVLLIHLPDYVRDFMNYEYSEQLMTSELPLNKEIRDFFLLATGGSILAAEEALTRGRTINLNGGFHHAFPDHAEGFCYLNDPAIAVQKLKIEGKIKRAAVIDCDLHQGNGTALIFRRDPDVFTYSIHQENLYPIKQQSDLDIGLPDDAGDKLYLEHLSREVPAIYDRHRPELVCYVAGADPYADDQLGTLQLTKDGLRRRDEIVIREALSRGMPIFVVLAGGYAFRTDDVVDIHYQTAEVLAKSL